VDVIPNINMKKIYLDNASTTRVCPEVASRIKKFFVDNYGNASSLHEEGKVAKKEVEASRKRIADFVGCGEGEIVFTSGGTESNNLAIRGLAKANPEKKHIVTSVIEHPSVLETCRDLEREGYKIDYLKVDKEGVVDLTELKRKIRTDTLLVSIMSVNNEIGVIQPIEEIGKICRRKGVYFHTDNVQGFAKVDFNFEAVDLMSVSGHKVGAPKGVGFLCVRKDVKILPIFTGGGQERGIRSGTENVPGIVGLASALGFLPDKKRILKSRDRIIKALLKIPGTRINGSLKRRVYHNISVSFYGIEGESLMMMLDDDGIFVSTGSACASTKLSESHVLSEIGSEELYINGSIRMTLSEDVLGNEDFVVDKIREGVERLREISPFKLNLEEVKDGRQI
jgi:cysteine desulfurase